MLGYWVVTAFVVDGAPVLAGAGATEETIIPVARGWIADPAQAGAPPSGPLTVSGRLIPAEAPIAKPNIPAGQVAALSTAELVNVWQASSYPAFIVSSEELSNGTDVGAHATAGDLKGITVTAQPDSTKVNWLNIFYSIEWVVFAGFAVFLWWRLVADEHRRKQEDELDAAEAASAEEASAEAASAEAAGGGDGGNGGNPDGGNPDTAASPTTEESTEAH